MAKPSAFLKNLLSQPTAPFREYHVLRTVLRRLVACKVPCFTDPIGNLVVGASSIDQYRRLLNRRHRDPLFVFIAHMDHPGFHGIEWLGGHRLRARWFGGAPVRGLQTATVWLANRQKTLGSGHIVTAKTTADKRTLETLTLRLDRPSAELLALPATHLFGGFSFLPQIRLSGDRIHARAIDDLAGVYCIVETAAALYRRQSSMAGRSRFIGLITRAEEVGFIGAIGHARRYWSPLPKRPCVAVSLEASRALPGAEIGKGPVIRLGDYRNQFSNPHSRAMAALAERVLPDEYQRRLMDGGICEGSVTCAFGIPTIGLAVPLGNYHNQPLETGVRPAPTAGAAPEFADVNDIEAQKKLCIALCEHGLDASQIYRHDQAGFLKRYRELAPHLMTPE